MIILFTILGIFSCNENTNKQKNGNTYLLIHGAWHGAWCWEKLIPHLEQKGNRVLAIDLPSHGQDTISPELVTMNSYIERVGETLNKIDEKVILVGHSLAGSVISICAENYPEEIKSLVYISAILPKNGQSLFEALEDPNPTEIQFYKVSEDGKTIDVVKENAKEAFYQDCEEDIIVSAIQELNVQPMAPYHTTFNLSEEAFGSIPKYFVECSKDNVFSRERQKRWYSETPCKKVYTMDTCHSPFLSQPEELSTILNEIGDIEKSSQQSAKSQ